LATAPDRSGGGASSAADLPPMTTVSSVALSPDGATLAVAGKRADYRDVARLWRIGDGGGREYLADLDPAGAGGPGGRGGRGGPAAAGADLRGVQPRRQGPRRRRRAALPPRQARPRRAGRLAARRPEAGRARALAARAPRRRAPARRAGR